MNLLSRLTNFSGKPNYISNNRYKLLAFVIAAIFIANVTGIIGWAINTVSSLEVNLPEQTWAAGNSCPPDGQCNANSQSNCEANSCCDWDTGAAKGGSPYCYCHCDPGDFCVNDNCESCSRGKCFKSFISWIGPKDNYHEYWGTEYQEGGFTKCKWYEEYDRDYKYKVTKYLKCPDLDPKYRNKKEDVKRATGTWYAEISVYREDNGGFWIHESDITPPNTNAKPSNIYHCVDIF